MSQRTNIAPEIRIFWSMTEEIFDIFICNK